MKSVMQFPDKQSEVFLIHPVWYMWTDEDAEPHGGPGKGAAETASLSHTAAETCAELLGLFGRQATIKTVVEYEQERL